jgi:hypothetical protein
MRQGADRYAAPWFADYSLVISVSKQVLSLLDHDIGATHMSATLDGPLGDIPVTAMAALLLAVDTALRAEGVDPEVIGRVRMRLIWGHPDGADATLRVTPEALREAQERWQIPGDMSGRMSARD